MASESEKTSLIKPSTEFSPDEEEKKIPDDLEYPITSFTDYSSEMTQFLFSSESDFMLKENYIQKLKTNDHDLNTIRQESISSIQQLSTQFDVFIAYFAVNYLDRFLSAQNFLTGKSWMTNLFATSCFSLAASTFCNFNHENLQNIGFVFDGKNVKQVECLIVGALKELMRPITPFSFLSFFIALAKLDDPALKYTLRGRTAEIIFKLQTEINLLGFKPSIIAASAILIVFEEQHPSKFSSFRDEITSSIFINTDRLDECCDMMNALLIHNNRSVSVSDSTLSLMVNQLDLDQNEKKTTTSSSNDSVSQAPSDDSTMVEPADRDDNNPIAQEKDIFQDQQK